MDGEDHDKDKMTWFVSELEKRDMDVLRPDLPSISKEDEWHAAFQNIGPEISPDTILIAKGLSAAYVLKEIEKTGYALKGLFIITDNNNKAEILERNFEILKKRILHFFIYAFQTNTDFPIKEAEALAQKFDVELFTLEGADDNSDYEDILADVLSLENS